MTTRKNGPKSNQDAAATPEASHVIMDPATLKLLAEAGLSSDTISHHGYFPKEIVRYLASLLKDSGVPCEVGYDLKLAESKTPQVAELREHFKDSKPFYFLAFPFEYRTTVIGLLATTDWPVPPDAEADKLATEMLATKQAHIETHKKRRGNTYLMLIVISALALLAFVWLGREFLSG